MTILQTDPWHYVFTLFLDDVDYFFTVNAWHEGQQGSYSFQKTKRDVAEMNILSRVDFFYRVDPWIPLLNLPPLLPPGNFIPPDSIFFTDERHGYIRYDAYNALNFELFNSSAPGSLVRKVIQISRTDQSSSSVLGGSYLKKYQITFTGPKKFIAQRMNNSVLASGNYTYSKPNNATVFCKFESDTKFYGIFAFSSARAGKGMLIDDHQGYASADNFQFTVFDCAYSITPSHAILQRSEDTLTLNAKSIGACPWRITTTNHWITFPEGNSGHGSGSVQLLVQPNETGAPRNGYLQGAGKTVVLAQGSDPAVTDIAGKTLFLEIESGTGNAATHGRMKFIAADTLDFRLIPLSTNLSGSLGTFSYSKFSEDQASLQFDGLDFTFTFSKAGFGSFIATNESGETQTGRFVLSVTAPDFNGDGRGDLLFQKQNGLLATWCMEGTSRVESKFMRGGVPFASGERAFGVADFDGNGHTDVVFQNAAARLNGASFEGTNEIGVFSLREERSSGLWRAFSVAELLEPGKRDIFFRHPDGRIAIWHFNSTNFVGGMVLRGGQPINPEWRTIATADFNGDLEPDILMQHTSGKIAIGWIHAGEYIGADLVRDGWIPMKSWRAIGTGDFNEDGKPDILWRNTSSNTLAAWLMDGPTFLQAVHVAAGKTVSAEWNLVN